jgi:hypothetical protein
MFDPDITATLCGVCSGEMARTFLSAIIHLLLLLWLKSGQSTSYLRTQEPKEALLLLAGHFHESHAASVPMLLTVEPQSIVASYDKGVRQIHSHLTSIDTRATLVFPIGLNHRRKQEKSKESGRDFPSL